MRFAGVAIGVLLLGACGGDPPTGAVEITWDRDVCEHCSMAISDRRYAAQVRLAGDARARVGDVRRAMRVLQATGAQQIALAVQGES